MLLDCLLFNQILLDWRDIGIWVLINGGSLATIEDIEVAARIIFIQLTFDSLGVSSLFILVRSSLGLSHL